MNVEPSMTSSDARAKVSAALQAAGYDVRPGTNRRGAFPFAIRVAGVEQGQETDVWAIVRSIDPDAREVQPASPWVRD